MFYNSSLQVGVIQQKKKKFTGRRVYLVSEVSLLRFNNN